MGYIFLRIEYIFCGESLMHNCCDIIYVRQDDRIYLRLFEKIIRFIYKVFFIVKCENLKEEKIILVPKKKRYTRVAIKIIANKVHKAYKNSNDYYIVFGKNLDFMKDSFDSDKVLDGKWLMRNSIQQILHYISLCNGQNMNLENIYVLVNKYTKENKYLIRSLIPNFKTVNIITDDLKHFKLLENRLYTEGILITVSNNKRKSVKKARYIVNLDFQKEEVEKYSINPNAVFINCVKEKNIIKNSFTGIIVNNIDGKLNPDLNEYMKEYYGIIDDNIFWESCLIQSNSYNLEIEEYCKKKYFEITGLYGIRGMINKSEFLH